MQTMEQLSLKIQQLCPEHLSNEDALEAGQNLIKFFKILASVAAQQGQET